MISRHGQAASRSIFPINLGLGNGRCSCDVLDVVVKVMVMEDVVLDGKMRREADRLMSQISRADSMIIAVKAGARAEGFVLGMETVGAMRAGDAERLYVIFEKALEARLMVLAPI